MDQALQDVPEDKEVDLILDHDCTHKKNDAWLKNYDGCVQFHFNFGRNGEPFLKVLF
ncbi:hypothetical protein [Methylobacter sp. YRD-M1]|uniref:hypothetical protein n=1 Tax=Methylobacter sp. YRD-M1 TaxID=2911520 RepID=UPI00227B6620|nr:hypothetical protein [Methylobacter sp. YRD-M1]WAK00554.1 hypothetical protein LZ558_11900 [Methylobacter sp. YRD-M1]